VTRDPLAPFDAEVLAAAAEAYVVDDDRLRSLVGRHQESIRDLPGVENLVYEWRRTLPRSPLVERRPDAYFCVVEIAIWAEFADALALSATEAEALRAVHARQFAASLFDDIDDTDDAGVDTDGDAGDDTDDAGVDTDGDAGDDTDDAADVDVGAAVAGGREPIVLTRE